MLPQGRPLQQAGWGQAIGSCAQEPEGNACAKVLGQEPDRDRVAGAQCEQSELSSRRPCKPELWLSFSSDSDRAMGQCWAHWCLAILSGSLNKHFHSVRSVPAALLGVRICSRIYELLLDLSSDTKTMEGEFREQASLHSITWVPTRQHRLTAALLSCWVETGCWEGQGEGGSPGWCHGPT